jgi:hypothetical protein
MGLQEKIGRSKFFAGIRKVDWFFADHPESRFESSSFTQTLNLVWYYHAGDAVYRQKRLAVWEIF